MTATYSRTTGETVAGSPYTISATLAPAGVLGNYDITYNTAAFTIDKALVTATAGGGSSTYDGLAKTPAACVFSGLYTGSLSCADTPASVGPNAGTTVIVPAVSGADLVNFDITNVNGAYVIDKAATTTVVTCPRA